MSQMNESSFESPQADRWIEIQNSMGRRDFLKLMGASLALAGLNSCTRMPAEKIIPYLVQTSQFTPGQPTFYASSFSLGGFSKGILVKSIDARPIKVEGNPFHPDSLGSTDIFMQAAVLSLYDPERSRTVSHLGLNSDWASFEKEVFKKAQDWTKSGGEGVRILSETVSSPSLGHELKSFLKLYPHAKWHQYEPLNYSLTRRATNLAFGQDLRPIYRFEKADVVLSLDFDFLGPGPGQQKYAHAFMSRRRPESGASPNRLYMTETNVSMTGAVADHRLALRPSEILPFALNIAKELGLRNVSEAPISDEMQKKARLIASDLKAHTGSALIVAGPNQDPTLQALSFALNEHLQNRNQTVYYIDPPEVASIDQFHSLEELVSDMRSGRVHSLFILGANPVYTAPKHLDILAGLSQVSFRVRLGAYDDETSFHCHWHLPEAHFLECWGDAVAIDGTVSLQQPLIAPLYEGRSALSVMSMLNGKPGVSDYERVRSFWAGKSSIENSGLKDPTLFESFFKSAIHDGVLKNTAFKPSEAHIRSDWLSSVPFKTSSAIEIIFVSDPTIWDGQFANNAWLQELPKPVTQLTWDNAALLAPETATQLGVSTGDVLRLTYENRNLEAPVFVLPGHAEKAMTLSMGYGRTRAGSIGSLRGYDAYTLQSFSSPFCINGVIIEKTSKKTKLADTQTHYRMEGRHLVVHGTYDELRKKGHEILPKKLREPYPSLMPEDSYTGEAWAMVIDLNICIGCKVCTIACQAENNIPVVGKNEVLNSREMHWIRVDRYFEGESKEPQTFFQPVPCMHCEKAPCEYVCPTAATNHSSDGLNQMIYNRCVGTRYCSNNCPYKVRRFNFFEYSSFEQSKLSSGNQQLRRNPDVTVRSRGVMEKCTYCVQRIQEARIEAEKLDRSLQDGDVVTACQAACPTSAIIFGDKNDSKSRVSQLRLSPRNYSLLGELGTQPRTTYLMKLKNPHSVFKNKNEEDM